MQSRRFGRRHAVKIRHATGAGLDELGVEDCGKRQRMAASA